MNRFGFDNDFSDLAPARRSLELLPEELEARLEERATEAYARGYADGATLERNTTDARLTASIEGLSERLGDLDANMRTSLAAQDETAARLAVALARKLATAIRHLEPLSALEDAFMDLVGDMRREREVAIAVHPDLAIEAEARLTSRAAEALAAFTIRIVPDADLMPGDGRITWSDGGLILDQSALDARIDTLIARLLPKEAAQP